MEEYVLQKSLFAKVTLSLLALFFTGLFFMFGYVVFSVGALTAVAGLLFVLCAGEIKICVTADSVRIVQAAWKILPLREKITEFSFTDIVRITQINTLYHAFHVIHLKNGKRISLLRGANAEFDSFLANLNSDLAEKYKEYESFNNVKDKQVENLRILLILLLAFAFPVIVVAMIAGGEVVGICVAVAFGLATAVLGYLIGKD